MLAHQLGPRTADAKFCQTAETIRNHKITKLLCRQILAGVSTCRIRVTHWLCSTPVVLVRLSCNSMFLQITEPERFWRSNCRLGQYNHLIILEILGPVLFMTVHVVQATSLQFQNPASSPDADVLHALALMPQRTTINGVRHTRSCLMPGAGLFFHRCRLVSRPL